ncbi:MAG TPA: hypothetical protein VF189_01475, partial [Patescibacteria group bacterium]
FATTGATFTTDVVCNGTNVNLFSDKDSVYLDGGPMHGGAAGLTDGYYYVQVTEPNGTLLGTSIGSSNSTPVHVTNGNFDQCYQLSAILIKNSDGTQGYDTTTNNGKEYKVWVSESSTFPGGSTKTDNFKVDNSPTPTTDPCQIEENCITPTVTPNDTPTPTATPSATPTPTNTPSNGGGSSDNNSSSNNNSNNNSTPSQEVLAASTMASTGTFTTTLMNFMLIAGMMVLALGAKSYASQKSK